MAVRVDVRPAPVGGHRRLDRVADMTDSGPSAETRELVEHRSRGRCERCGNYAPRSPFTGDDHHRCPRQMGGSKDVPWINLASNIVRLCWNCHTLIESHRDLGRQTGWLVRRPLAMRMGGTGFMPVIDLNLERWVLTDLGEKRLYVEADWNNYIEANY